MSGRISIRAGQLLPRLGMGCLPDIICGVNKNRNKTMKKRIPDSPIGCPRKTRLSGENLENSGSQFGKIAWTFICQAQFCDARLGGKLKKSVLAIAKLLADNADRTPLIRKQRHFV